MPGFTENQEKAILATGNVLVMAGAGTGKTRTLVERAVRWAARPGNRLDHILIVTFTEAAASEIRERLRAEIEARLPEAIHPAHLTEQLGLLETAYIGTLHAFCLRLIKEHFYLLELDPEAQVLDPPEAALMSEEVLAAMLSREYETSESGLRTIHSLVQNHCLGREASLKFLIRKLHGYAQTLPDPDKWFREQLGSYEPDGVVRWRELFQTACLEWRIRWIPELKASPQHPLLDECIKALETYPVQFSPEAVRPILERISAASDADWKGKKGTHRDPVAKLFQEAEFLLSLIPGPAEKGVDPIGEDFEWAREEMREILRLAREFGGCFARAKREASRLDFHDLEQMALALLWNRASDEPSMLALEWRERLKLIFVDEYQDINAAQDGILRALGGAGTSANRFLGGDIKQSIYRFRLAAPAIFRRYAEEWGQGEDGGRVIALSDNFRSEGSILNFINGLFRSIMQAAVGDVAYDVDAELKAGFESPQSKRILDGSVRPRVTLELIKEKKAAEHTPSEEEEEEFEELTTAERQAQFVGSRLLKLQSSGYEIWDSDRGKFRAVAWGDMVILLRAPSRKIETYAREFARLKIPIRASAGNFFESIEIMDILNLFRILDNPLQDIPLLAVLRSPFGGFTANDLAQIREEARRAHFWAALHAASRNAPVSGLAQKVRQFLKKCRRWRDWLRRQSLSDAFERILLESEYEAWALAGPTGPRRSANLQKLGELIRQFEKSQSRGLYRFLGLIDALEKAGLEEEAAPVASNDSVRLMSIHQSKGLEFPVVVLADLDKMWNLADLQARVILDEKYGLCPRIKPASSNKHYPSLPYWLAQKRQRREMLGEELRLLYVAMTRAQDTLILAGSVTDKKLERWSESPLERYSSRKILGSVSWLDWIGPWLHVATGDTNWMARTSGQGPLLQWNIHESMEYFGPVPVERPPEVAGLKDLPAKATELANWKYPWVEAIHEPAKATVSALRQRLSEEHEAVLWFPPSARRSGHDGAARGEAHHLFLQLAGLESLESEPSLREEADRFEQGGLLQAAQKAALDFGAINRFWQSTIGTEIRAHWQNVQREIPFTARFSMEELSNLSLIPPDKVLAGEFVVVQGIADLIVRFERETWLLDFKTDRISEAELDSKIEQYQGQVALYALALERVFGVPVTKRLLHFFALNQTCEN